jgi:putative colanic acid biosynthesis acetyltransferase WcaF
MMTSHGTGILDARKSGSHEHGGPSFSLSHRFFRACWNLIWITLASWTPPPLHKWRILLLRLFGAKVDWSCHVYGSVRVWYPPNLEMATRAALGPRADCYAMSRITLGNRAIVSQGAHLCGGTHDLDDPHFQLYALPIHIGADAWIAAEAFVGPGVNVGQGAVLGARGVAFRDLEAWTVYAGNPAQKIRKRAITQDE